MLGCCGYYNMGGFINCIRRRSTALHTTKARNVSPTVSLQYSHHSLALTYAGRLQSPFVWGLGGRRPPRNSFVWATWRLRRQVAHTERVARDFVPRAPNFATALFIYGYNLDVHQSECYTRSNSPCITHVRVSISAVSYVKAAMRLRCIILKR